MKRRWWAARARIGLVTPTSPSVGEPSSLYTSQDRVLGLQFSLAAGCERAFRSGAQVWRVRTAMGTTHTMGWSDLIGRQLGQYTILEEIGRGGSSRVYRGRDAEMQRDVAIKVLANDAEDRVAFVRRFEREVQAVAQLNHPNIVTVYDRGESDDLVYLVMQCVMGGTLRTRLGRPLPTADAVHAVMQMAHALHHAHLRGIVHRDVKPSNMLIDAENPQHLLLTDFGIAKLQGAGGLTKTGTTIGTPEYMAPEQAEGKDIDPRADVYSLGCVLYEALAGRPPFIGSSPVSVLYQQVHARPAYIRGFNPDVPRDLTRVLELALAKRPDDRYGTAERLAEALAPFAEEQASSGTPVNSRPLTPSPSTSRPLSRSQSTSLRPVFTPREDAEGAEATWPTVPPADPLAAPGTPAASLASLGLNMPVAQQRSQGLGLEGLNAIFPDDPEARAERERTAAASSEPQPQRPDGALPGDTHTIPLPAFRLPTKGTRPLGMPLKPNGELDLDALLGQVEPPRIYPSTPRPQSGQPGGPSLETYQPSEFMPNYGPSFGQDYVGGYEASSAYQPGGQPAAYGRPKMDDQPEESLTALRKAILETNMQRVPREVWRPEDENRPGAPVAKRPQKRKPAKRRPLWAGLGLVAVLLLSVVTWVGVSASGIGLTLFGHARPTPQPTVTATPRASATTTPAPTFTATTNPQIAIDQQAAAAFRNVTLARFADGGCYNANRTTQFTSGQAIYVNLCSAANGPGGVMTVDIRQGGQILFTLIAGKSVSPGSAYWYARYGLAPGTYHVVVTLRFNGTTGTARDLVFSVS